MSRTKRTKTVLIAVAIAAVTSATPGRAAPLAGSSLYALSLEELMQVEVGIASKQPETVRKAPSAVTVFTRNEIRAMGIDNVYELLNFVPGFQATRLIDTVDQSLLHSRGLANLNGDLLFLLNGHRLNENSLGLTPRFIRNLSTANIKQVEIIRGPGSALYGSNAFLGVVDIITLSGENDADLHLGAYDNLGGHANLNKSFGPLTADLSFAYDRDRGQEYAKVQDYPQGPTTTSDPQQDLNFYSTLALHGAKLELAYMKHQDQDFLKMNGVAPAGEGWSDSSFTMVSLSREWKPAEAWALKGGLTFTRHALTAVGWNGPAKPPAATHDALLGPYNQHSAYEANLDSTYRLDGKSDLLLGLAYSHAGTDFLGISTNYLSPSHATTQKDAFYLGGAAQVEDIPSQASLVRFADSYGLYTQYRRDLSETLHATAGLRFDQYEVTGATTNPRLGLIWDAEQDLTLKAFWGTAFRAPSLLELYVNTPVRVGNLALKPETIATTELVCQKRFRSLELEGVYFHNSLEDVIERKVPISASDPRQTWVNGDARSYDGVEARILWDPLAALRFTLTHTHVFSGLEANTFADFSSFIVDYHPGLWRLNLNGTYRHPEESGLGTSNSYVVANAKLSYALNQTFTLYGKGENLFDYRYTTVESDVSSTFFDTVPNRGLRWMVGIEAQW